MLKKLVVLIFVLIASPLTAQQLVEGIAAVVGKEIILRSEVEQYTNQYLLQNRINVQKNPDLVSKIRNQTLNFLIEQKLLLEKAEQDIRKKILERKKRYKNNTPVPSYKGKLPWPVKGKVIIGFGEQKDSQLGASIQNKGIDIKSSFEESVYAVTSGKILYADWFQGYGKLILIDHGDEYCTIYAHLSEIFVKKGDIISTGHKIASVGDTCSIHGPELYFEIRHKGKPLNPMKWLRNTKKGKR